MKVEWTNKDNLSVETTGQNNKAILVIDMPKDCASGCPVMCMTRGINHRPSWCPLKPLPEKKNEINVGQMNSEEYYKGVGWNACLDAITGGKE